MINIIKGLLYRNCYDSEVKDRYMTCSFTYRDKSFCIHNLENVDSKPYLGAKLDLKAAKELKEWLEGCIEFSKQCDDCWNIQLPEGVDYHGEVSCSKCGHLIKGKEE